MEAKRRINWNYNSTKDIIEELKIPTEKEIDPEEELRSFLKRTRGPYSVYSNPSNEELSLFANEMIERKNAEERGEKYIPKEYYKEEQEKEGIKKGLWPFLSSGLGIKIILFTELILCAIYNGGIYDKVTVFGNIMIFVGSVVFAVIVYFILNVKKIYKYYLKDPE